MTLLSRLHALPLAALRDSLEYDPTSPSGLRWTAHTGGKTRAGKVAGCRKVDGYYKLKFRYRDISTHHLVLLLHDSWPEPDQVCDHVDRNRGNNRIENLRWVTKSINERNKGTWGAVPYKFVHYHANRKANPYAAVYIHPHTKRHIHVGVYDDPYTAHLAAITHRLEHCWRP